MDLERVKYLKEVLNETDETREKGLKEIKDWAQSNLKLSIRLEDKYILPFLRVSKYNIDRAKAKITNFYTQKRDVPEWFVDRNPRLESVKEFIDLGCYNILRQTKTDNQLAIIYRTAVHDPKVHKLDDLLKAAFMVFEVACMEEEKAQIYGWTVIVDFDGFSFAHASQYTLPMVRKTINAMLNYHCRPQQIEFINAPYFFNVILNVFKAFLSEKLKKRVRVHDTDGNTAVQEILGLEITPKEYGGNGDSIAEISRHWQEKLESYSKWFVEDAKYKAQ